MSDTKGGNGNGARRGPRRQRARPDSKLTAKMRQKGYLLSTEVAKRIGVHKATLYRWIKDGVVDALDFNGAYYIRWESVVAHLGEVANVLGFTPDINSGSDGAEAMDC